MITEPRQSARWTTPKEPEKQWHPSCTVSKYFYTHIQDMHEQKSEGITINNIKQCQK